MVDVPPLNGTAVGAALMFSRAAAAAPIGMRTLPCEPEDAVITAIPDSAPATKVTVALPATDSAVSGWTDPSVAPKLTTVPSGAGWPSDFRTSATISAMPLKPSEPGVAVSVTVDPDGATEDRSTRRSDSRPREGPRRRGTRRRSGGCRQRASGA
jgi:hypothetical protein